MSGTKREFWTLFSVVKVEISGSRCLSVHTCAFRGIPPPTEHIQIIYHITLVVAAIGRLRSTSSQVVLLGIIAQFAKHRSGSVTSPSESCAARPPHTSLADSRLSVGILTLIGVFTMMSFQALHYSAHRRRIARVSDLVVARKASETGSSIVKLLLLLSRAGVGPPSS